MRIGEFKEPAGSFIEIDAGAVPGPIGTDAAFFFQQPANGGFDLEVRRIDLRFGQGVHGDAGVPDGRDAGLDADGVAFLDEEIEDFLVAFDHQRMIFGIAEAMEEDEHVGHRREDRAQAFGVLRVLDQPFQRLFQGAFAQAGKGGLAVNFQELIDAKEEIAPGSGEAAGRIGEAIGGLMIPVEFGDTLFRPKFPHGAEGGDHGQGQDDGARPGGDVIEIEVKPFGEKHDLRRDAGAGVETDLAEAGEIEFGERIAFFGAAQAADQLPRPDHVRSAGRIAHELEGEISFDRAGQIGRALGKQIPSAIGLLEVAEIVGDFDEAGVVFLLEDEFEEDEFRFQDAVALKLAAPEAAIILPAEEGSLGTVDGIIESGAAASGRLHGIGQKHGEGG